MVLPFRLFTVGLFFRMSSKVSDACTKAAGAVYSRALYQGVYAVLVVLGALAGQRWGIGGVAVAVSIAMGINWLMMAALARSVTGLSWPRFVRAQTSGAVLAAFMGGCVAVVVEAARAMHIGKFPILLAAGTTAVVVGLMAVRLRSEFLLGRHGVWAARHASELLGRVFGRILPRRAPDDGLRSVGKASPK